MNERNEGYYANYLPQIEKQIMDYMAYGYTAREAIEEVGVLGYLKERLIEKFERVWR